MDTATTTASSRDTQVANSYLILPDSDVMFRSQVQYVNRTFIPVSRHVKVINTHQDFPE